MDTPQIFKSAEEILDTDDTRYRTIWVPEWTTNIVVRNLWGYERDALEQMATAGQVTNVSGAMARIVTWGALDREGPGAKQLFNQSQVERLNKKNAGPIVRLATAIKKLSAITDEDLEKMVATLPNDPGASGGIDTPRRSDAPLTSSSED